MSLTTRSTSRFAQLPEEILLYILSLTGQPHRTAQVCKLWKEISSDRSLYSFLLQQYQASSLLSRYLGPVQKDPKKNIAAAFEKIFLATERVGLDEGEMKKQCKEADLYSPIYLAALVQNIDTVEQKAKSYKIVAEMLFGGMESLNLDSLTPRARIFKIQEMIDKNITGIRKLKELDFSSTHLTHLPGKAPLFRFFNPYWGTIKKLNFQDSSLKKLPEGILKFTNLEHLNIAENPDLDVTDVSEVCQALSCLKEVVIDRASVQMMHLFTTKFPQIKQTLYYYEEIDGSGW